MLEIIQKGGPLMYLIILCSIFALAIFVERLIHLYRAEIDTEKFMQQIREIINKNKIKQAIEICASTPGPIASILKAGMLKYDRTKEDIKQSIEDAGLKEIPKLEKNLNMLSTIAHIAPLLGLLGTVAGMISAFKMIQEKTAFGIAVNPGDLAGGIWEALVTTAAGLVVAIPAYVAYNYLVNRVNNMVLEMEETSTELVDVLVSGRDTANEI